MAFSPFVVGSGLTAWSTLKATLSRQKASFAQNTLVKADAEHFRTKYSALRSPDDVINDKSVMRVVLGAYGLSDDINSQFFIRKVLADGISDPSALANKLSDRRYKNLAAAFDFSNVAGRPAALPTADFIIQMYKDSRFEAELGIQDNDLRLALSFNRQLGDIANGGAKNSTAWFQVLGTPPLRQVFEVSLGLPKEFSRLDIDQQHSRIIEKSRQIFGTDDLSKLSEATNSETVVRRFLLQKQNANINTYSSYNTALVLLSASAR